MTLLTFILFLAQGNVSIIVCGNLKYATDAVAGVEVEKPLEISINVTKNMFVN